MRLKTKTRYGLRFMIDLAQHWGEGPQPMRTVAERQGISKKYLEQVVIPLSGAGLIDVYRGQAGGYELSRPPEEISMAEIMSATEGGLGILECLNDSSACSRSDACPTIGVWRDLQDTIVEYMSRRSLRELSADTLDLRFGHERP